MNKRPFPLKPIIVAVASMTTVSAILLGAWIVAQASTHSLSKQIGRTMAVVAHDIIDRIDFTLHERYEDLASFAITAAESAELTSTTIQPKIESALRANPSFKWLALYAPDTTLIGSAGDESTGYPKAGPPRIELIAPLLTKGKPTFRLVPPLDAETGKGPVRWLIQVSTGVFDQSGLPRAIVVAWLDWEFVQTLLAAVRRSYLDGNDARIVVMSGDQNILVALPSRTLGPSIDPGSNPSISSRTGSFVGATTDGTSYVTGFSRAGPDRKIDNLDLVVMVSQTAEIAHVALFDLRNLILLYAAFITLIAIAIHWSVATVLTRPLLKLAAAADALRLSKATSIPRLAQYAEVKTLSDSLVSLVGELKEREAALISLSTSLDQQVRERTQRLARKNQLLMEAKMVAEQAIVAKNRLLAVASHDLRQPLHALGLFTHALRRKVTAPDAQRLVLRQEQSVASLTKMFDELLHIARLDAGLIERTLVPVGLRELVDRIGAEFTLQADERGLRFNSISADCVIKTDPALFETIVRNLLSNAFKFTASGGIFLAGRLRDRNVLVEVYDTGPGIAPSRIANVFQEFERSVQQAVGPNNGLGLGLSIVARNAALIGVKVSVKSKVGRGSRFSIEVPLAAVGETVHVEQPQALQAGSIAGITVMLLDDNTDACEALASELTYRGAAVSAFRSIVEARSAMASGLKPEVAVVDYDLGGDITGLDIAAEWRKQNFEIKVVILTGRTDGPTLTKIVDSQIDWLPKPAAADAIERVIARLAYSHACQADDKAASA